MPLTKRTAPLMTQLKCFLRGHAWVKSKSHPGYLTCRRCRQRRPAPETSIAENVAIGARRAP